MLRLVLLLLILIPAAPRAAEIRVDPDGQGDFASLSDALADGAVARGDTVTLAPGWHGPLLLDGEALAAGEGPVALAAEPGTRALRLAVTGPGQWIVEGLRLGPREVGPPDAEPWLSTGPQTAGSTFRDITIAGAPGGAGGWSRRDWRDRARHGLLLGGRRHHAEDIEIRDTYHAAVITAPGSTVRDLDIRGFAGDGVRALADDLVVEDSRIRDCVDVDDNHDDGIQSWSLGPDGPGTGVIRNVTLRRNLIVQRTAPHPFGCILQGIGLFDGIFEDWRIENNVVRVGHPHGITVMGARRVQVVNNTVLGPRQTRYSHPWVTITEHKDGRPAEDSLIAGNIAGSLNFDGFDAEKRATDPDDTRLIGNVVAPDPGEVLQGPPFDLAPIEGGAAHDLGGWDAPETDFFGRPRAGPPDAGAFERQDD